MSLDALAAGIVAVLSAALGVLLVVREFRRRDHRSLQRALDDTEAELAVLRRDLIDARRFAFEAAMQLAAHGIDVPEAVLPWKMDHE